MLKEAVDDGTTQISNHSSLRSIKEERKMTNVDKTQIRTGGLGVTNPTGRSIPFTIDGQPYTTDNISQKASALLRLAGLDPANYDLGELQNKDQPTPKRFVDDETVEITKDAVFVSIREKGPVA